MIKTKYYDGILEAQKTQRPAAELPAFNIERLRTTKSLIGRVLSPLAPEPRTVFRVLRRFWPMLRIGKFLLVTRNADVREILERQDVFETPYGPEMTEIAGGFNFILGMQDGPTYRRMKSTVLSAFPVDEIGWKVREIAAQHSQEIMQRAGPGFDVVRHLLKIVPARICRDYYGMTIDDDNEFVDWSNALSGLFFGDPGGKPIVRELAVVAAAHMTRAVDLSIQAVREGRTDRETPLGRLVEMLDRDTPAVSLGEVHSIMLGMIAGFAPTNLLAAGNCLDVILSRPEAQKAVEDAVADGDNEQLDRAIREAMRFKPIWFGPFRYAAQDVVIAKGTSRERTVKAGTSVMPATFSAMFDSDAVERPDEFDTNRPARDYLLFGHGIHQCIGAAMAKIQIAEAFRALFTKKGVRRAKGRAGKLNSLGAYPESLKVDFETSPLSKTMTHSMVTVICKVEPGVSLKALREKVAAFGNPATGQIAAALDANGSIHFASLAVACKAEPADEKSDDEAHLVLELSGDGTDEAVMDNFAATAGHLVRGIFEEAGGLSSAEALETLMRKHAVKISQLFGSNAGLVFSGTPGHSVARIHAEAKLENAARQIIATMDRPGGENAGKTLAKVRERLAENKDYGWALEPAEGLLELPGGSGWRAAWMTFKAPWVFFPTVIMLLVLWWMTFNLTFGLGGGVIRIAFLSILALGLTLGGLIVFFGIIGGLLYLGLRRLEKRDVPSETSVDPDRLETIISRENHILQNNLTAISVMKPSTMRRLALRLAFYIISISAKSIYRPGFLSGINTIHFARWVLLPGTNKLMFFSNYGGSWESYLEDFIAKAHLGLTGVWSNTLGFPRARALFWKGATDGDRFKRWARLQQIPTLFWYSAYPELNTGRIRMNSLIRSGIAKAETESEARDWLGLFGSTPRPPGTLETREIQTIFFGPLGPLHLGQMVAVRIPDGLPRTKRKAWLKYVALRTSFANQLPKDCATVAMFGPQGLVRLGLDDAAANGGLSTFPSVFRQGMGSPARSRVLDDVGNSAPEKWDWGSPEKPVDAVVVFYADDEKILKQNVAAFEKETKAAGMTIAAQLPLAVNRKGDLAFEHFGFADGISQPVINGTPRSSKPVDPMHQVAPGEFLFGYKDELGFYPPTPTIPSSLDRTGILPEIEKEELPLFGCESDLRDFGRNGTFVVMRQIEQHVEKFHGFCQAAAKEHRRKSNNAAITPHWIAAKMVGRWQDGTSLVRNPNARGAREPDNDFSFADEDPQGLQCPLGSHVRRSNPRDSLGEDRAAQIKINKRHRILRVGRTYEKDGEKGLLFMCLNADIERQYEFMQQSWVSAVSFNGLQEKDPAIGTQKDDAGRFSIPSPEGSIVLEKLPSFVTTRGGGYFFMPSRSAMQYLISRL
ncbi:cytochrome P450 [Mesorhizobium sp. CGMCC 1.15528]|uniref:Cytochrome P450 n=1 Tax=Mesorhizobium zhangyense TaxID=1776730 RepID=A0A7C9R958_9HYPH|nr:cytochrome P450 [Mesorhizobium zhangyense]NGN42936.1 cytochrome P450 [Mesorhizobium zhangyense]